MPHWEQGFHTDKWIHELTREELIKLSLQQPTFNEFKKKFAEIDEREFIDNDYMEEMSYYYKKMEKHFDTDYYRAFVDQLYFTMRHKNITVDDVNFIKNTYLLATGGDIYEIMMALLKSQPIIIAKDWPDDADLDKVEWISELPSKWGVRVRVKVKRRRKISEF